MTYADPPFPRIMGMVIGRKHYDDILYANEICRAHVAVLGFYPGWRGADGSNIQEAVARLKARNPQILLAQYTVLSEAPDAGDVTSADTDKGRKLDQANWWLRNAAGQRVQWTPQYAAYETEITQWSTPDSTGLLYPEWLARRDAALYFNAVPGLDAWFFDNALDKPPADLADWNKDGVNDSRLNPVIAREHRKGHVRHWKEARALCPDVFQIGNAQDLSSPEFSDRLNGAFLEALIGLSWSLEQQSGWGAVRNRYYSAMANTRAPKLVGFNVHGAKTDYQRMRYGLATCLLHNGYYCYTDSAAGYASVPWYDEYDVELGDPKEPPPVAAWSSGVYRRNYQRGTVLVNPTNSAQTVALERGYLRILGAQDPTVNTGEKVITVTLNSKDGLVLIKPGAKTTTRVIVDTVRAHALSPAQLRVSFGGLVINGESNTLTFGTPADPVYSVVVPVETRASVIRRAALLQLTKQFLVRPADIQFLTF